MREPTVLTFILAGGTGDRLRPLTLRRCKPAVPFGGNFRVIDFTLMNCVSSGLERVHVLTQYMPETLGHHIDERWSVLSASGNGRGNQQSYQVRCPERGKAYLGTADAIHQNFELVDLWRPDIVLILSGDHIYHADYRNLIRAHLRRDADLTLLTGSVPIKEASSFGITNISRNDVITGFIEKPSDPKPFARDGACAINLGVYCFHPDFLRELLVADAGDENSSHDFGKDILPVSVKSGVVTSCSLEEVTPGSLIYWRDVGTLKTFFEANMDLVRSPAPFELTDCRWPATSIFREWAPQRCPVSTRIDGRLVHGHNILADHVRNEGASIVNSVISAGVHIGRDSHLEECIVFPGAEVGDGVRLRRVIIEQGSRVPDYCEIDEGSAAGVRVFPDRPLSTAQHPGPSRRDRSIAVVI